MKKLLLLTILVFTSFFSSPLYSQTCITPTTLSVSSITTNSAAFSWANGTLNDTKWEILLVPSETVVLPTIAPPANPTFVGQILQTIQMPNSSPFQITGLESGKYYFYYLRTICSDSDFSEWSLPYTFNTQFCNAVDKCDFKFRMTSSSNSGWFGARMQVRQNGIVVATIGSTYTSGNGPVDVIVPLCKNIPFDLYWKVEGTQPTRPIVRIYNSFDQLIYTKVAGVGAVGDILYSETAVNCDLPECYIAPVNLVCNNQTTTSAQLAWSAPATTTWDVYYVPTGSAPPTPATVPSIAGVSSNPYTVSGLPPDTTYDFYVRVVCSPNPSAWSAVNTCTTIATCPKPTPLTVTVGTITQTQAVLNWTTGTPATDDTWEILLIPSPTYTLPTTLPPVNGPYPTGSLTYNVSGIGTTSFIATGLTPATIYFYYIRTVCPGPDKSTWGTALPTTNPIAFNTFICDAVNKCGYKFVLTNPTGNSWNGGYMIVRQNGIIIQTLGANSINNAAGVTVQLCNNVPFDLYWSVAGTMPQQIGVTIQNPFTDVIYTKAPGMGSPLDILYNSTVVCTPPSCPKPITLTVVNNTTDGATLGWTEVGTATQWEVYTVPVGNPLPINGQPLSAGTGDYRIVNGTGPIVTYPISGLLSGTAYVYYVRAICSPTSFSTWTILDPKTFNTISGNDECTTAVPVPVNTGRNCVQQVAGNTLGSTNSGLIITETGCGTTDDDVWFSFVATNSIHIVNLSAIVPTPSTATVAINHTVFSGNCTSLVKIYCSTASVSVATGLNIGETYYIRVYTSGSVAANSAAFNICITTPPAPNANDECINALPVPVNTLTECDVMTPTYISGATGSTEPIGANTATNNTCFGNANDDVWYSFVANSGTEIVSLLNVYGTTTNLNHAIYSGDCNALVRINCSADNSLQTVTKNLIIGNTYYIRAWSNEASSQVSYFDLCVKPVSSCQNGELFCGSTANDPYIYNNTTGLSDSSQVACLGSIPNPTFFTLKVEESGNLAYNIIQNSNFDVLGNPTGNTLDVDFVAWGPFLSADSCDQIAFSDCPTCPFDNFPPNNTFYPNGNIIDCSYSTSNNETLTINNAVVGQYYKVLITNFSDDPGYIKFLQTNYGEPNSGRTSCSDKLLLIAFVDLNNNGIKDSNEYNFTYGTFNYQINNSGATTSVTSPFGKYSLYDTNSSNTYDITYQIFPEYANYYALTATNFNDVSIVVNGGTQTLFFPITITQNYNDVAVSIVPVGQPVSGSNYTNKIVYTNLGITLASGTITFNNNAITSINTISQTGIVTTPTGFTFDFVNLAPFQTREISVIMHVPPIPVTNIGDLLTTNATITTTDDINLTNNTFTNTQAVVASFDPNDKMESHGGKIQINNFSQDDYLNYTIRFQNTGNSNAINVRLEDLLDSRYDFQSIRMIAASHNYTLERVNNHLVWKFENIQLKPAAQNEELSKGYVTFKIKLNPGFAVGNIIPNTANIYFDSNPAITTNTFNTEFVSSLANTSFNLDNIQVYPNPSNDFIHVDMNITYEKLESIVLYNVLGESVKKVSAIASNQTLIDVSDLTKGVYLLEITSENKLKFTKKLVIK